MTEMEEESNLDSIPELIPENVEDKKDLQPKEEPISYAEYLDKSLECLFNQNHALHNALHEYLKTNVQEKIEEKHGKSVHER